AQPTCMGRSTADTTGAGTAGASVCPVPDSMAAAGLTTKRAARCPETPPSICPSGGACTRGGASKGSNTGRMLWYSPTIPLLMIVAAKMPTATPKTANAAIIGTFDFGWGAPASTGTASAPMPSTAHEYSWGIHVSPSSGGFKPLGLLPARYSPVDL